MQCSVTLEKDLSGGNMVKMVNNIQNTCRKDYNLDNIVDQQCTRFQDITKQGNAFRVGMPTCSVDQTEAVRRYYAAFPALKKGQESPLQYYLPPPAWCRKTEADQKANMQSELSIITKDWNSKNKKLSTGKERRNSYHGQRKNNKKRCNSYSRSFESKESLPEWVTHEGVWDMDTQDPVKEFIRAIALDEGYGTCENTVTDDLKDIARVEFRLDDKAAPSWDDGLDIDAAWLVADDLDPRARSPVEEELYAKFEAKFDRSIEALWKDQNNTPDDEYQDLPIDFQDLLASPSDNLFDDPAAEAGLASLTESIWSAASDVPPRECPSRLADSLQPLRLAEREPPRPLDPFALYEGDDIYDSAEDVARAMRSLAAINHSRERSGFVEVPPRRLAPPPPARAAPPRPAPLTAPPDADPLTSARTHFRPVRREADAEPRYADGDSFDIRGDLDAVEFRRSDSGGVYVEGSGERYLEYRGEKSIDYGRLRLTAAQRCPDLDDPAFRLRFPLRQRDAGVQTDAPPPPAWCGECGGGAARTKRPRAMETIWSARDAACKCAPVPPPPPPPPDELTREWEELLSDISAAHADAAAPEPEPAPDRKRRHSAALRCGGAPCSHPHARFLACCSLLDRPLTR